MKAGLRATTILAGLVAAQAAMAQTAGPKAPFSAFLDGDAQTYMAVQSSTRNNGSVNVPAAAANSHGRAFGMVQNAEMRFTFQGIADNGLTYGWFARIGGTSSGVATNQWTIDREDLFIRHRDWGQIQLGNNSSAGKGAFPYTQCDYGPLLNVNSFCPDGGSEQIMMSDPNALGLDSVMVKLGADAPFSRGRAMGLYYASPRMAGFDVILDYAPDGTKRNEENFTTTTSATATTLATASTNKFQHIADIAVHYTWANGPLSGKLGGGITYAEGKYIYGVTSTGATTRTKAVTDALGFQAGASVQWGQFRLATDWSFKGKNASANNATNKPTAWGYSLMLERYSYSIYQPDDKGPGAGDWGYGIWYQFAREAGPYFTPGVWEINYLGVGGGYWLAQGLQVFAEAFFYNDYNTHPYGTGGNISFGTPSSARNPRGQIYFVGLSVEW